MMRMLAAILLFLLFLGGTRVSAGEIPPLDRRIPSSPVKTATFALG